MLIDHFVKSLSTGNLAPHFERKALRVLKDYSFPGNVRELRNIIEHAVTLSLGETVKYEHLPEYLTQGTKLRDMLQAGAPIKGRNDVPLMARPKAAPRSGMMLKKK